MLMDDFLTADASLPLITCDQLRDELLIYNLNSRAQICLQNQFINLTGKEISPQSKITELSGGQKVILMVLLALNSPAPRILFVNIMQSLDPLRRSDVQALIDSSPKQIVMEDRS